MKLKVYVKLIKQANGNQFYSRYTFNNSKQIYSVKASKASNLTLPDTTFTIEVSASDVIKKDNTLYICSSDVNIVVLDSNAYKAQKAQELEEEFATDETEIF